MRRRDFLQTAGFTLAHFMIRPELSLAAAPRSESLILATAWDREGGLIGPASTGYFSFFDLNKDQVKSFAVPVFGHEILPHPHERNLVFTLAKRGSKAAFINYKTQKIENLVEAGKGFRFNGHAVFSKDGKFLYCTEISEDNVGWISQRSVQDLSVVERFSSGGSSPHQLRWLDQDKSLLALNTNRHSLQSQIQRIDLKTQKSSLWFDAGKGFEFSHFDHLAKENLLSVAGRTSQETQRESGETVVLAGSLQTAKALPLQSLQGESISIANSIDLKLLLGSSFEGGEAFLYDYDQKQVLWKYQAKGKITGVCFLPDNQRIAVCDSSTNMSIFSLERKNKSLQVKELRSLAFRSSAHLLIFRV